MAAPFQLSVPVGATEHGFGPPDAPVTVVEYGDFQCPNCKQAAPAMKLLLKHFDDQVRLVWRHFPLVEVHPDALNAAVSSEAAAAQGKFWPMHDLLFDNQQHLDRDYLRGYAESLALAMARYDTEVSEGVHLKRVRDDLQSGRRSGVRATPTFFVNGSLQDASYGVQALFARVEAERKR